MELKLILKQPKSLLDFDGLISSAIQIPKKHNQILLQSSEPDLVKAADVITWRPESFELDFIAIKCLADVTYEVLLEFVDPIKYSDFLTLSERAVL